MKRLVSKILIVVSILLTCSFVFTAFTFASGEDVLNIPEAVNSEFDGKRIGLQAGTTQEALVGKYFKNPEVFYYNSLPDAIIALESGKLDAFLGDDIPLLYAAGETEGLMVLGVGGKNIDSSLIFQKSEKGDVLREQFNDFIAEYKASGKLAAVTKKWVEGPEELRTVERAELDGVNGTITIVGEIGYAPFEYYKNGEVVGLEFEVVQDFCKEYGYKPEVYNTSFDSIIIGVFTGKYDMAMSGLTITEERKKSVNFGEPFVTAHDGLLVRKDGGWTGTEQALESNDTKQTFIEFMVDGFTRTFITEQRWKMFVSGIAITLEITILSALFGSALGFLIYLLCRNENKIVNAIIGVARWLITGMPLVVFLMVLFYIVFAKGELEGVGVAIVGFTIVFAFTMFDLMKAGENSVDIGQKDAAYALGYTDLGAFMRIILPQAASQFMPSYIGSVIALIKDTAVVGYITVLDVTRIGDIVRGRTYDAIFPLLSVVVAYFVLSAVLKAVLKLVTRKLDTKKRSTTDIMKGVTIR